MKKIYRMIMLLMIFVSSHAFSQNPGSLQTKTSTQKEGKEEEKKTFRFIPEIERKLIDSSVDLGAAWKPQTGFLLAGKITKEFYNKFNLGLTLGYDSYLSSDMTAQPYFLYGSNLGILVVDQVFNKSLDVALNLSYLNKNIIQWVQPNLIAKYVFRETKHFLISSSNFNQYFVDKAYSNSFLENPYASVKIPLRGYETAFSYNYQLSDILLLSFESSYLNQTLTKKNNFKDHYIKISEKKLQFTPMIGFWGIAQLGYGYEALNKKWNIVVKSRLIEFNL